MTRNRPSRRGRIIYALVDPRIELPRYIGRSSSGMFRPWHHTCPAVLKKDRTHKGNWIRELLALRLRPRVVVLQTLSDEMDLNEREVSWIAYGRSLGWPLTNHTEGGFGLNGHRFSEEHKAKLSAANKGKTLSAETRIKISVARTGKPLSMAHRQKIGQKFAGIPLCAEHKAKIGAGNRGKVYGPETRAKISQINSRPVLHVQTGLVYGSLKLAAQALGLWDKYIGACARGQRSSYKGHSFRYVDSTSGAIA